VFMNRRDLLKYFGAGSVITPLVAGPVVTLVEPPKVELAKDMPRDEPIIMSDVRAAAVVFEMADGTRRTLRGDVSYANRGVMRGPRCSVEISQVSGFSPQSYAGRLIVNGLMV
jgi:hypothetical protein